MQPPPQRKAKILQQLKNVQNEHLAKLQQKYQFELELLEDIRVYMKQRAGIDKDYAQALQKLNSQFSHKHEAQDSSPSAASNRVPLEVWKVLLDESEKLAKERLSNSEIIMTDIAEQIKSVKAIKGQAAKKSQELAMKLHDEINTSVRNLTKSRKEYIEQEKLASVAREQAVGAEDRLKKRASVKFYRSKAQLEKNVSKRTERKDACEVQCTLARNEYILALVAANAHMTRYFDVDIPNLLQMQDSEFYSKVKEYLGKLGSLELDIHAKAADSYKMIHSEAEMISGEYNVQLFMEKNKVFTEKITYKFEPCADDKVSKISKEPSAEVSLNKDARRIASRYAQDLKKIKEKKKSLRGLAAVSSVINKTEDASTIAESKQEATQTADSLREEIRILEVQRLKGEAQLQALRQAGVNVDEWIQHCEQDDAVEIPETTEWDGGQNSVDSWERARQDSFDDDMIQDDDEWDPDSTYGLESDDEGSQSFKEANPVPCVALFDYEATSPDELTIREHDKLEILERDGEGWCRGQNSNGDIGFFPESYVEVISENSYTQSPPDSTNASISSSSSSTYPDTPPEVQGCPTEAANEEKPLPQHICIARALYDYEALNDDEISLQEGDIIRVLRKDDETDDGFWEGVIDNRKGFFPSVLVEETLSLDEESVLNLDAGTFHSTYSDISSSPTRSSLESFNRTTAKNQSEEFKRGPSRPPPPKVIPSSSTTGQNTTTAGEYVYLSGKNEAQDGSSEIRPSGRCYTAPMTVPHPRARFSSTPSSKSSH